MIESYINGFNDVIPTWGSFATCSCTLCYCECFTHNVNAISIKVENFIIPRINFIKLELHSHLIVRGKRYLFNQRRALSEYFVTSQNSIVVACCNNLSLKRIDYIPTIWICKSWRDKSCVNIIRIRSSYWISRI